MKPTQSLAGYIRQHLKELEERLEVGVRQEAIVAELETYGYKTTLKGFRNFLYRARTRVRKKNISASAQPVKPMPPADEPFSAADHSDIDKEITNQAENPTGSHRPSDLDAIHDQEIDLRSLAKLAKRNKQ